MQVRDVADVEETKQERKKKHFGKWTLGPERRGYHREALQWRVNKTKTQPADGERERER